MPRQSSRTPDEGSSSGTGAALERGRVLARRTTAEPAPVTIATTSRPCSSPNGTTKTTVAAPHEGSQRHPQTLLDRANVALPHSSPGGGGGALRCAASTGLVKAAALPSGSPTTGEARAPEGVMRPRRRHKELAVPSRPQQSARRRGGRPLDDREPRSPALRRWFHPTLCSTTM
jgi:hypothetical protein